MNQNKITNDVNYKSQSKTVKVAGFMFLFAFIVPTFNWAFVLSKFNEAENIVDTADKIMANELLFRLGVTVELFMTIGLIVLGVALYLLLKMVNKNLALLALLLKLIEATIAAAIVLVTFIAMLILTSEDLLTAFTPIQLQMPISFLLKSHTALYSIPMAFLGLDMIIFSYLLYKSKYIPGKLALFGILSFALIFIHALMFILTPEYATMPINQIIFWAPSGLFEIIIGIWLLAKGINVEQVDGYKVEDSKK